uniref:Ig-like domain-containing protein n=1 Tax=Poecilia mexicana TaxID=48701 RepID=A0A3B3WW26_9TELE
PVLLVGVFLVSVLFMLASCLLSGLSLPCSSFTSPRLILAKLGDSVVMHPGQTFDSISAIIWKHNMNIIVEWSGANTTLDKTTGSLIISSLAVEDTGHYNPEIDSKILEPVPKPTVSEACNKEKTVCNLTCEADITSEFGPVTYEWKTGDTELSTNKELSITEKNKESSCSCSLRNPVSNSASDEFPNPFNGGELQIFLSIFSLAKTLFTF